MDLALLKNLKEMVQTSKDLSKPWVYFMDHFGEKDEFMALGEAARDEMIEEVIGQVGAQLFKKSFAITELRLIRLAKQNFIHGGFIVAGKLSNLFYFEDIHSGIMAIIMSDMPPDARIIRFSARPMPKSREPSNN